MTDPWDRPGSEPWWLGKSEEEIQAHLEQVRARAEAQHAVELEAALSATTEEHSWPPMPSTAHPSFQQQAGFVRELMARGEHRVLLAVSRPLRISEPLEEIVSADAPRHVVLDVQRAMTSHVPWTERPYVYMWRVAVESSTNRWVAGDSWVEHPPPGQEWRAR